MKPGSATAPATRDLATLPLLLSIVAGLTDVTTFVLLGGMFSAHITGNLVVLAADAADGRSVHLTTVLAVPFFILITAAVTAAVSRSTRPAERWIHPLTLVQLAFLAAAGALAISTHASDDPAGIAALGTGLLAVAAMAAQNALLHVVFRKAPSTAVMTGNVVEATVAGVRVLLGKPGTTADDRATWHRTWPLVVGFLAGCFVGGLAGGTLRDVGWLLPIGAAFVVAAATSRTVAPSRG